MITVRPNPELEGHLAGSLTPRRRRVWLRRLEHLLCIPMAAMLIVGSSTAAYAELCSGTRWMS
jgi:hypothetical protein